MIPANGIHRNPRITQEWIIARALIAEIRSEGFLVSVWDGGAFSIDRSNNEADILRSMWETDQDTLVLYKSTGERVGHIFLVYGNGDDLISDYTDLPVIDELVKTVSFKLHGSRS